MTEGDIKALIKVVTDYFLSISDEPAKMGLPYIKRGNDQTFDYTGIIGISGSRRGGVYFTAGKELLREFGQCILGDPDLDEDSLVDLVGEMTNTIAGNMRETFGSSFLISVPMVMKGKIDDISMRLKPPVFIIPIEWHGHSSHLAVGLE
jgi:chemotaxis protein CheX